MGQAFLNDLLLCSSDELCASLEPPFHLVDRHHLLFVPCQEVVERQNTSLAIDACEHFTGKTGTVCLLMFLVTLCFQEAFKPLKKSLSFSHVPIESL